MKDSEQGHFRSVTSEWIQLSLPSSPLRLNSFLVSVPLPPESRPVHGQAQVRSGGPAVGLTDGDEVMMNGWREGRSRQRQLINKRQDVEPVQR